MISPVTIFYCNVIEFLIIPAFLGSLRTEFVAGSFHALIGTQTSIPPIPVCGLLISVLPFQVATEDRWLGKISLQQLTCKMQVKIARVEA